MKRRKIIIASVVLLLVFVVGRTVAYFTDTESVTNTFTIGNVDITLTEPNWNDTDDNNNGVPDENKTEDYELTTFFGIVPRNRYFSIEDASNRNDKFKWTYLISILPDNQSIYNWFTSNGTDTSKVELVASFREAMISYNP